MLADKFGLSAAERTSSSTMLRGVDTLRRRPGFEPAVSIPAGCAYSPADALPRAVGQRAALTGPGPTRHLPGGTYRYEPSQSDFMLRQAESEARVFQAESLVRRLGAEPADPK